MSKALPTYRTVSVLAALLLASLLAGSHLFGAGAHTVASRELGQIDFGHNSIDFLTASKLSYPSSVALDRAACRPIGCTSPTPPTTGLSVIRTHPNWPTAVRRT